ncbi:two-partner secretion domain-containing protein [Nostoc sp.]|uniref:two-partner secretion domain-containing protein n=1 Tax=Nostoc sp. TaxID=1180 RepID=UPI002FF44B92
MTIKYALNKCLQLGLTGFLGWLNISLFINKTLAQPSNIVPDNTLGAESSQVIGNFQGQPIEVITGGAIRQINLFHSFGEFNVSADRGAYFFTPNADIQNILARVTGNNPSEILGNLGTFQIINGNIAGSNANLFLINPNGIVFGKDASLNVQGSFVGTTASSVKFADGREFSATTPQNAPLLTISIPLGLQFGANPGKITVQGDGTGLRSTVDLIDTNSGLRVPSNQTLALVGDDINLEGATIKTAGGRIELGSVSGEGLVSLNSTDKGFSLGYSGVQNFGNIQLTQKASVDASGTGAGDVQVTGKRITLSDGSQIEASTLEANNGGGLVVNATESVELNNTLTYLAAQVYPGATGNGGNLTISTKDLLVRDGAFISTSTSGKGKGGNLTVNASGSVQLIGSGLDSYAQRDSTGNAGDITVNAQTINLSNQAIIRSSNAGQGNAGNILVQAQDNFFANNSLIASNIGSPQGQQAKGNVGNIEISARTVSLSNGAQLQAGFYSGGEGNAGLVSVKAQDTISFTGTNSGIFANVESGAVGNGSDIQISAPSVSFTDGAVLSSGNDGQANGGNIDINTQNLLMRNGTKVFSGTSGKGKGGNLTVNASGSVQFIDGGLNSSTQPGSIGNAGNITLKAQTINLSNQGFITSSTLGQGQGGKISLKAEDTISLSDGSTITSNSGASSFGGVNSESSGDIEIRTRKLSIDGGANTFITSTNLDDGKAGNIQIIADDFISLNGLVSISSSSSGKGDGGNIELQTRSLTLANGGNIGTQSSGHGSSGDLLVNASDSVSLSGITTLIDRQTGEKITTGSRLTTSAFSTGNSGQLTINTERLSVLDGGDISTASQLGHPGNLTINAKDSIEVVSSSLNTTPSTISTSTLGSRDAGDLQVDTQNLLISDRAGVFVNSLGTGNAGIMTINADRINLDNKASLNANTRSPNKDPNREQATINLNTQNLTLRHGSNITTDATGENVFGGNINIYTTKFLIALENSRISVNSDNSRGGRVVVNSQGAFVGTQPSDVSKYITANSGVGLSGTVDVNSPDNSSIQNSFTGLSPNVIDTNALIANSCISRGTKRQENSFTITGSGALRYTPGDVLTSAYTTGDVRNVEPAPRPWKKGDPIIEPQGLYQLPNGQLILSRSCSK